MINEFKSYHGSAFADLIDDSSVPIKIFRPDQDNNAFYVSNSNIALGVGPHLEDDDMRYIAESLTSVLEKVLA